MASNPPSPTVEKTGISADGTPVLYCANHPDVETLLRCNRCNKPICVKCAVQTPVGYRCRECIAEQQKKYFNAVTGDNLIAFAVSFGVTLVATPIIGFFLGVFSWLGFIIAFLAGSAAGSALAQAVRAAVKRRRGPNLRWFALAGIILGVIAGSMIAVVTYGGFPLFSPAVLIFTGLAIASALPFLR
jgi:hypothetical protein